MKTLLAAILLSLAFLAPNLLNDTEASAVYPDAMALHQYGRREFAMPVFHPGYAFDSPGGYVSEFVNLRRKLIHRHIPIRLRNCASACTMLLSVPGACVEPDGVFMFHGARDITTHQLNPIASDFLWSMIPPYVRANLQSFMNGQDQYVPNRALIASGARPCR